MSLYPLMLASKLTRPFESYKWPQYVMEPKLDGMRVGVQVKDGEVTIYSRTFKTQQGKLPQLEAACLAVGKDFVLDGEIISLDNQEIASPQGGLPIGNFARTMRIMKSGNGKAAVRQAADPLTFVAFDILSIEGADIRFANDMARRNTLTEIVAPMLSHARARILPRLVPDLDTYMAYVTAGGEGMIFKDTSARYVGKRSKAWIKVKATATEDVVITGYKEGKGKYSDTIGAIIFAQYDQDGNLIERGACSGMNDDLRYLIGNSREALIGTVMEVRHFGYSSQNGLRHPQFMRFRDDKLPKDCTV